MPTLEEARRQTIDALCQAGIDRNEAHREADLLLEHVTGLSKTRQMAQPEMELESAALEQLQKLLSSRRERIPLQYLLGEQWFMGLRFHVRSGVLIPRADTETLVEAAIAKLSSISDPVFMDIGCGSGAIVVSLLHRLKSSRAIAVDISQTAVEVTAENAHALGVADRLTIVQKDWRKVEPQQTFDAIVCNPPYVPVALAAELQPEVAVFEPKEAIFGLGEDGLGFFRELSSEAERYLRDGGFMFVEVGQGQADDVSALLRTAGWSQIETHFDLNGIARCISAVHAVGAISNQP